MQVFLKKCKTIVSENKLTYDLILGNEAGDLDSVISALTLGFIRNQIPVVNTTKEILSLRCEIKYCLNNICNINDLVYINEIQRDKVNSITLVDHHQVSSKFKQFSPFVKEIIDHHPDCGDFHLIDNRVIDPSVGSCATLISEMLKVEEPNLSPKIISEVSKLLLFPIISDTSNLDLTINRTSQRDINAASYLYSKFQQEDVPSLKYFEEVSDIIMDLKSNELNMKTLDILQKDYKELLVGDLRVGFSATHIAFEVWHERDKEQWMKDINTFIDINKLDLLVIITVTGKTGSLSLKSELGFSNTEYISPDEFPTILKLGPKNMFSTFQYHLKSNLITRKLFLPMLIDQLKNKK